MSVHCYQWVNGCTVIYIYIYNCIMNVTCNFHSTSDLTGDFNMNAWNEQWHPRESPQMGIGPARIHGNNLDPIIVKTCFSPPARWGLLDFIRAVLLILLLILVLLLLLLLLPPPPRPPPLLPPLPPLPRLLLPCQLLAKLFANFGAQCALLDLNLGHAR